MCKRRARIALILRGDSSKGGQDVYQWSPMGSVALPVFPPLAICPSSCFSGFGVFRLSTVRPFGLPHNHYPHGMVRQGVSGPTQRGNQRVYSRDRDSRQSSALARRSRGAIGDVEESSWEGGQDPGCLCRGRDLAEDSGG